MPVVRKRGALFPVYHDSPDTKHPGSASAKPHAHGKKDVLSGRSPTLRHKSKASSSSSGSKAGVLGGLKPSQSALAASAALQCQTANGTGTSRKPLALLSTHTTNASASRAALVLSSKSTLGAAAAGEKENLRSLGMGVSEQGNTTGKLRVFADEVENPGKRTELGPRTRRALGEKTRRSETHAPTPTSASASVSIEQENIPPPGEYTADRPAPAMRRVTRKATTGSFLTTFTSVGPSPAPRTRSSARHDSVLGDSVDPESPYLVKPRLRKVMPSAGANTSLSYVGQPSSQTTSVHIVSSQSHPEDHHHDIFSSPLITRPQTRKQTTRTTSTSKSNPITARPPPSTSTIDPDPILCDVSEAYGADRTVQPAGFEQAFVPRRSTRRLVVKRDRVGHDSAGGPSDLPYSTYGWQQIAEGEYQAPTPPTSRGKKQKQAGW